jgi:hypothetical protein
MTCTKCGYPMPCPHHLPPKPPITGPRLLELGIKAGAVEAQNCSQPYWETALSPYGREVWTKLAELLVEEMKT